MTSPHPIATFPALGTSATLALTDPAAGPRALAILEEEIERIDLACSRFRDDSELVALNARAGTGPVRVSILLLDAIEAAVRAARVTGGLVDPTVGTALELAGYDRDFALIERDGPPLTYQARPVPGWRAVVVSRRSASVALPAGTRLDLGATAKALAADRAAARIARAAGAGVLVGLGGDIAVAGAGPDGGWPVKVAPDHNQPPDGPGPVVAVREGGLATSSTAVRRWRRGGEVAHHLIDPASSRPAATAWETVSVSAGSCLDANIASCAAMLMGPTAASWLEEQQLPSRLATADGRVTVVAGWPVEKALACS